MLIDDGKDKETILPEEKNCGEILEHTELLQFLDEAKWFQSLAENFTDVLWTTDLTFRTVYVSPSIFKLTGESPEDHLKRSLSERYPPSSEAVLLRIFADEMLEEANPKRDLSRSRIIEVELYKADGSTVWVSLNVSFIRDKANNPIGIKGLTRDISQRIQTEEILNSTRQTYLDIFNTISEAIYIQDEDDTFIDVNEGAARMYGCTRGDLIGKNPQDVAAHGMNDFTKIKTQTQEVRKTGIPATFEFWAKRKSGEIFPKDMIVNRGVYFGKSVLIATARDNTERKQAEEKLQESEELYRKLLKTVPDLIIRSNIEGNIVYVNEFSQEYFPFYSREAIIGRNILSFIAEEDLERATTNSKLMLEKQLGLREYRLMNDDGQVFDCEVNGDVLYDAHNIPAGMVYVIRNISQRKQADKEIYKFTEMLQLILDNIPQCVYWKDRNSVYLGCNENFARVSGLNSAVDIAGKTDYDMTWKKEEADFFVDCDQRVMSTGKAEYHIIEPQTDAKGNVTWLDTNKIPLYDNDGKIIGILGTYKDITAQLFEDEQVRLQAHLRQLLVEISTAYINLPIESVETEIANSLSKLSEFVDADRYYMFDYDDKTRICTKTHEWCKVGIKPMKDDMQHVLLQDEWVDAFRNGKPMYIPDLSEYANGIIKDILEPQNVITLIAFPMLQSDKCIGFIGFDSVKTKHHYSETEQQLLQVFTQMLVNIRLRKHSEEELIKAKEKAEESDRLKLAFLANMSHEIRTPMNGILGFASLLKEANLTGEQRKEYIGLIEKSGARMLNVINDIMSISKIEAGLMKVNNREINVNEQIEYIYAFFKPEVVHKGMKLLLHSSLPATEAIVQTDPEKLYAILSNLVKNSIKYSYQGTIEVGYEKKDNLLEFFVKDSGIGIPAKKLEMIFERFIQADGTNTRAYEGAGLGLSIAKAYVEMLGGRIWVESEEGEGSTFYFTIPHLIKLHSSSEQQAHKLKSMAESKLKSLKVLVAEDDEVSFKLISKIMASHCDEILRVKTGGDAVKMCRVHPDLDLILMDVKMPEMNGYEATREIRKLGMDVVIIAQTAYGMASDCDMAINAGCNDYIAKPINQVELYDIIFKHIDKIQ